LTGLLEGRGGPDCSLYTCMNQMLNDNIDTFYIAFIAILKEYTLSPGTDIGIHPLSMNGFQQAIYRYLGLRRNNLLDTNTNTSYTSLHVIHI
jgi:hypothetical protein